MSIVKIRERQGLARRTALGGPGCKRDWNLAVRYQPSVWRVALFAAVRRWFEVSVCIEQILWQLSSFIMLHGNEIEYVAGSDM